MAEAHRLLRVAGLKIGRVDPATPAARWCVAHYFAELDPAVRGWVRSRCQPASRRS
jgi:hypothetical protein